MEMPTYHNFILKNGVVAHNCLAHGLEYAKISYATAFLKYHYPIEWWCALLQNADKEEIETKFWKHCNKFVTPPDLNKSGDNFQIVGDKIIAPISSLQGIGPKAHKQLCDGRPYKDIDDFCKKIEQYRIDNPVTTKTGQIRKGTSPINAGTVASLIITGVMDSLYPDNPSLEDKMKAYETGTVAAGGGKVSLAKYNKTNPLEMYLHKRTILQSYTENMCALCINNQVPNIYVINGMPRYAYKGQNIPFLGARELGILESPDYIFIGQHQIAVPAYVISEQIKTFQGTKQRQILLLDIEGERKEYIRWGDYKTGKFPKDAEMDIEGSLVIAVIDRYRADKEYTIKDVQIVANAIK